MIYAEVKYKQLKWDGVEVWEQAVGVLKGLPIEIHQATRFWVGVFAAALAKEKNTGLTTAELCNGVDA